MPGALPIDPLLPEIVASLARQPSLVIVAPPGAGKTTRVPPALLEGLAEGGEVWVAEPRRLAARAAARHVAAARGVDLGGEVGFRVRLERRAGPDTRLTYVTAGVLLRRLQADPALEGVAAVVLDEVHERSLEVDLALALLAEAQRELRPELGLVAMSATVEAAPLAAYWGDCPVLEAAGRVHPVAVEHAERADDRPLERRVAAAVSRVLSDPADDGGHLLVFLPGAAEIRRAAEALAPLAEGAGLAVRPLHGDMEGAAQDAALASVGPRKVILATNVAETSLTIDGVTCVVDSGLCRQLSQDPRTGLDRLRTTPISRAAADQRAGRAGRTAPGRVVRLWSRAEHLGRPQRERPEVQRVDLAGAVLQVRAWGCADPADFPWFEPPPAAALARADGLLAQLGAVDRTGVTPSGRQMLRLPLHPRQARMLLSAHEAGCLAEGSLLCALAAERDVLLSARVFGGAPSAPEVVGSSDLLYRLELLTEAGRSSDAVLRGFGLDPRAVRRVRAVARQLAGVAQRHLGPADRQAPTERGLLAVLAAGAPDRVALRRQAETTRLLLAGGREAELVGQSVVREGRLLIAHRVLDSDHGRAARVLWASQVDEALLAAVAPAALRETEALVFDEGAQRVVWRRSRAFGDLVLHAEDGPAPDRVAAGAVLARAVAADPARALAPDAEVQRWLARARFGAQHLPEADWPPFDDEALAGLAAELCQGLISIEELRGADLLGALRGRLSHTQRQLLRTEVPERLTVPSGSRIRLDYPSDPQADEPPVLAVRIQEIFGLAETPRVARGRVAVLLHLLSPARRPVQVTRDLQSFWDRGYGEVRAELKGRYPKHHWPEDPRRAQPTRRTKRRRK